MGLLVVILAPAIFSLVETGRDLYCDTALIRNVILKTELGHLRTNQIRRAGRIEHYLESSHAEPTQKLLRSVFEKADRAQFANLFDLPASSPSKLESYWALTDPDGAIILHSLNGSGQPTVRLTSAWDDDKQVDLGEDVVRVLQDSLTGDQLAYNVFLPIHVRGKWIGTLHSGLNASLIDQRIAQEQRAFLWKRSWIVAILTTVNLAAITAIICCARKFDWYRASLRARDESESRKLTQIGFGLAHEIRNPLHAIRLNAHTLRRSFSGKALSEQEMSEMMRESCDEIDRIEAQMRSLVQYVSPQTNEAPAELELDRETEAALQLQIEEFRRRSIDVKFQSEKGLFVVRGIPSQLRALLHELFTFAQRSAGTGGKVEVRLRRSSGAAELLVIDHGRPLSPRDLENLFEPFHATPYSDAGLALALVRQYAQKGGGTLHRIQSESDNQFQLRLPLIQQ